MLEPLRFSPVNIPFSFPAADCRGRVYVFRLPIAAVMFLISMVTIPVQAFQPAGACTAVWDGTDAAGTPVGSGIYFCILQA